MKTDLLSKSVWVVALQGRLEFLIDQDEYGNSKEILGRVHTIVLKKIKG